MIKKGKIFTISDILTFKTILLLSIFMIGSCKKNNPEEFIPDYEKGHIVTCKINDEDWFHYSGKISHPESIEIHFRKSSFGGGLLTIDAYNRANNPFDNAVMLWLAVDEDFKNINWATNNPLDCYRDFHLADVCGFRYKLDTSFNNTFILESFDSNNKEVIGRFDYRAINTECSDTVHISSGYFDVYYDKI